MQHKQRGGRKAHTALQWHSFLVRMPTEANKRGTVSLTGVYVQYLHVYNTVGLKLHHILCCVMAMQAGLGVGSIIWQKETVASGSGCYRANGCSLEARGQFCAGHVLCLLKQTSVPQGEKEQADLTPFYLFLIPAVIVLATQGAEELPGIHPSCLFPQQFLFGVQLGCRPKLC